MSLVGIFAARVMRNGNPATVLRSALIFPPVILVAVTAGLLPVLGVSQGVTGALAAGAIGGAVIGLLTEYYTAWSPVRRVAESSKTGAGTNVIHGPPLVWKAPSPRCLWSRSSPTPLTLALGGSMVLACMGSRSPAVGMLAGTAIVMTVDALWSDDRSKRGRHPEMSHLGKEVRDITDELDAVGNMTAAIGKGFAIGSATLTVVALFSAFKQEVEHTLGKALDLNVARPEILIGLLIGATLRLLRRCDHDVGGWPCGGHDC